MTKGKKNRARIGGKMQKIYIVLTHTGTILSRIIKTYPGDEFSHISISLNKELTEMYSFGRLNPYNPFWGGFVHEYINKGTYKRFFRTQTKVYELEVTDEQYNKIKDNIEKIKNDEVKYKFNIIGLFAVGFHKTIKREHSFYCAEFVRYVLENAGLKIDLPVPAKPEEFKNIQGLKEVYKGLLRKYDL